MSELRAPNVPRFLSALRADNSGGDREMRALLVGRVERCHHAVNRRCPRMTSARPTFWDSIVGAEVR